MIEFKAELTADHCQTTAEQRALPEEWCSDFRLELYMVLPLLLLQPAGTLIEKAAKSQRQIITISCCVDDHS